MRFIDYWTHVEKEPISKKTILDEMKKKNEPYETIVYSLNGLLKLGYLRKAIMNGEGDSETKVRYVQLRRL